MAHPLISSKRVEGTTVYSTAGDKLGSIDEVMIDKHTGHVAYAVLEVGGFLGIGTDRYPVPWKLLDYDTTKDGYVVPIDKSKLEAAPHHTRDAAPDYDDAYGRKVYDYYNLPWV